MNILFISLGCDKNLVDSEVMLGLLNAKGYCIVDDEMKADVIVINTCCFIHDAKEESIQTILEMAEYKKKGGLRHWWLQDALLRDISRRFLRRYQRWMRFLELLPMIRLPGR